MLRGSKVKPDMFMLIKLADGAANKVYQLTAGVFVTLSNVNSWIGRGVEYKCSNSEQALEEKSNVATT